MEGYIFACNFRIYLANRGYEDGLLVSTHHAEGWALEAVIRTNLQYRIVPEGGAVSWLIYHCGRKCKERLDFIRTYTPNAFVFRSRAWSITTAAEGVFFVGPNRPSGSTVLLACWRMRGFFSFVVKKQV